MPDDFSRADSITWMPPTLAFDRQAPVYYEGELDRIKALRELDALEQKLRKREEAELEIEVAEAIESIKKAQ